MKTVFEKIIGIPDAYAIKNQPLAILQVLNDEEYSLAIVRLSFFDCGAYQTSEKITYVSKRYKTFDTEKFLRENSNYALPTVFEGKNVNDVIIIAVDEYHKIISILARGGYLRDASEEEIENFNS